MAALKVIFETRDISRMRRIAGELAKAEKATRSSPSIGESLSGASASRFIEIPLRIIAAHQGAQAGGGAGGSIQTAQMASSRIRDALN